MYGGGILPGGYDTINKKGGLKNKYYNKRKRDNKFWSPYARPPRRSKRLVLVWVGAFLLAGFLTWYIASRSRISTKGVDVAGSGSAPPEQ